MASHLAILAVDRDAGEVAHVLVGPGQLVEERGLSAVLVACQCKGERCALRRDHTLGVPVMGLFGRLAGCAALTERRVRGISEMWVAAGYVVRLVHIGKLDAGGVILAQGELVAAQPNLERIAHGGSLDHGDLGTRRKPHVKDVLAQGFLVAANGQDVRILADFQRVQCHG